MKILPYYDHFHNNIEEEDPELQILIAKKRKRKQGRYIIFSKDIEYGTRVKIPLNEVSAYDRTDSVDIGMAFDVQRMKARQRNNWFVHLTPVHRPVNVFVEITRNGCKCQENSGLLGRPFPHPRQGRATISQLQLQLHKG